jgi:hypothetical protein
MHREKKDICCENEEWKVLKSLPFLFGNLIPTVSKSEGQVIKPL